MKRVTIVGIAGALAVSAALVAPASGAPEGQGRSARRVGATPAASFGTFTPAAADPRLAALIARGGLDGDAFHFTPAETRRANRAVTVAVRSRTLRSSPAVQRVETAQAGTVGLAPIAYNLGVAVGWKRFAIAGDVAHVDLAGQPDSRESADVGVTYRLHRFTGRVKGNVNRPLADAPALVAPAQSYSVDVGGAYSLSRNVDVTAGVRYRMDRDRLERLDQDPRRDSQAVYVGTAFRF